MDSYLLPVMTAWFLLAAPNLRAAQSGKCGDSITGTLDDYGVLTLEGIGRVEKRKAQEAEHQKRQEAEKQREEQA